MLLVGLVQLFLSFIPTVGNIAWMIVYDRFIDSIIGSIYRSIFEDPEAAPAAIIVEK